VAFSLYGQVTGLKGEAEAGVTMEAVGQGECARYQEEATSGPDGGFRVRGLQPACSYTVGLKASRSNVHVERTIPAALAVHVGRQDVRGVSVIAIRPRTNMDVSLLVKVKKADSVKNIKAKLFCGLADSPVHMVKMDGQRFVIFPSIPLDGASCHVTVEASATQAGHRVSPGRVDFTADKPIEHHQVELELESAHGKGDIGQASWLTLPAIILIITALLQWDKVSPLVASVAGSLERLVGVGLARRAVSPSRTTAANMTEEEINNAVRFVETRAGPRKVKVKPSHYTG